MNFSYQFADQEWELYYSNFVDSTFATGLSWTWGWLRDMDFKSWHTYNTKRHLGTQMPPVTVTQTYLLWPIKKIVKTLIFYSSCELRKKIRPPLG